MLMTNSVFVVYMNVYLICLCNEKIVDETLPVYLSTGAQKCGYMNFVKFSHRPHQ